MDLTTSFPRSVHDPMLGVVMLSRATDKAKAKAHGTIGEYNYDCPMDKGVFSFLGIDAEQYLEVVKNAKSDHDIEAYAKTFVDKKSADEIKQFNEGFVKSAPEKGSQGDTYFHGLRDSIDPSRTDITTWADLLDLDEKRHVPHRALV